MSTAFGLAPVFDPQNPTIASPAQMARRRVIRQSDTAPLAVGDMCADLLEDSGSAGTPAATAVWFSTVKGRRGCWGVVLAVEPQTPLQPAGSDGISLSVPAVKASDYFVWVQEMSPTRDYWALVIPSLTPIRIGSGGSLAFAAASSFGRSKGYINDYNDDFHIAGIAPDSEFRGNAAAHAAGQPAVYVVRCRLCPLGIKAM